MKSKKMGKDVLLFKGIGYPLIAITLLKMVTFYGLRIFRWQHISLFSKTREKY